MLTTCILATHFAFLAYVVTGGFLAWRWPRAIWPHLVAVAWGVLVVAARLTCPLTHAEDWSRRRAGGAGLTAGFIDRYVEDIVYPERHTVLAQGLVAVAVLASWTGFAARTRPRARPSPG